MRWAGHVAHVEAMRNICKALVGNSERNEPPMRPMRRWEYNIKREIKEALDRVQIGSG
jgi:hypothetical protein